ncbi:MAG TPA: aldehyde dehydrogenase family protein [Hyphomicrobiaceae bacterium]|jgi:sulfoacetaldehyde dehydrogenase|nr:aldehyde dehydrogenase family protein [Hyphomicrobiaceae bacterium]
MPEANLAAKPAAVRDAEQCVAPLIARARAAMAEYAKQISAHGQARIDEAVTALAWSIYKPENARRLAEIAVAVTGIGEVESKVIKNQRKTFGTLRDLLRVKSTGIIEENPDQGLVLYAKPVGVVGAITPSTNPSATPVNKAMMALKGGNAIIIAPPPSAWAASKPTVDGMRAALATIGLPADLVQILPNPVTREATTQLMQAVDLVVVTGSQVNVRQAYKSGKPALGVGLGNAPVIIDDTADLDQAANLIMQSKTFDHATSCSSENAVVILDAVYDKAIAALQRQGGYMASGAERTRIVDRLWQDGKLNRAVIAQGPQALIDVFELAPNAKGCKFVMVSETGTGKRYPLSGEKLSLVLTVYRAKDFADAKRTVRDILEYQGKGHSCGIHTKNAGHAREIAEDIDVVRVLVNQAHTFGNGGGFNNGLPFTLSMGCGTWQGNAISENLNWRCFVNITHLVTTIPEDKPSEEQLFGAYWAKYGK